MHKFLIVSLGKIHIAISWLVKPAYPVAYPWLLIQGAYPRSLSGIASYVRADRGSAAPTDKLLRSRQEKQNLS